MAEVGLARVVTPNEEIQPGWLKAHIDKRLEIVRSEVLKHDPFLSSGQVRTRGPGNSPVGTAEHSPAIHRWEPERGVPPPVP